MGEAVVVFYPHFEVACYEGGVDECGVGAVDWDVGVCGGVVGWAGGHCGVLGNLLLHLLCLIVC